MKRIIAIWAAALLLLISPQTISANDDRRQYGDYIEQVAELYGICPELIEAVIYYESAYDANCVSGHGAIGLMQIIPKWNKERMTRLGVTDLYDPYQNILCGADLIAELSDKYEVYDALAAYNLGENSKTFKNVLNGAKWDYSEKILHRTEQLERAHGK